MRRARNVRWNLLAGGISLCLAVAALATPPLSAQVASQPAVLRFPPVTPVGQSHWRNVEKPLQNVFLPPRVPAVGGQKPGFETRLEYQPWESETTPGPEPESGGLAGESTTTLVGSCQPDSRDNDASWFRDVRTGYDDGFLIASRREVDLAAGDFPFRLRMNGWGQLRQTVFDSQGPTRDLNQFQLKRARLVFSGNAFTSDFSYFVQLDGRSSSGDDLRLLDYYLDYDIGHHLWGCDQGTIIFRTGKYKMPFTLARYLSGRELEFTDRSLASTYFDVNRSLAWGLGGGRERSWIPWEWEAAVFNGLVTGVAETGSSGTLDNNFAYSGRLFAYPIGEWGEGALADFDDHQTLAVRVGGGIAFTTIDELGATEFASVRVVDSGARLADLLPTEVNGYRVALYAVDAGFKYRGWSLTTETYFRYVDGFSGGTAPGLFDHGFWFQVGKFVIPRKLQLLARWSRVAGDSGTLGVENQSSDEIAGGMVWYFRGQHAKLTLDVTHLDGAPINSSALDIAPGDIGWLFRSQIQFAF